MATQGGDDNDDVDESVLPSKKTPKKKTPKKKKVKLSPMAEKANGLKRPDDDDESDDSEPELSKFGFPLNWFYH
jgi:hypothetical protein